MQSDHARNGEARYISCMCISARRDWHPASENTRQLMIFFFFWIWFWPPVCAERSVSTDEAVVAFPHLGGQPSLPTSRFTICARGQACQLGVVSNEQLSRRLDVSSTDKLRGLSPVFRSLRAGRSHMAWGRWRCDGKRRVQRPGCNAGLLPSSSVAQRRMFRNFRWQPPLRDEA